MQSNKEEIEGLKKRLDERDRQDEIRREVELAINNQKKGLAKYIFEIARILVALAVLSVAGDSAIEKYPWIPNLMK